MRARGSWRMGGGCSRERRWKSLVTPRFRVTRYRPCGRGQIRPPRGIPGAHTTTNTSADSSEVNNRWDASIRARLGYLWTPTTLVYATGGVSWLNTRATASCPSAPSFGAGGWCGITPQTNIFEKTMVGWTIGGGFEWMFRPNWTVRGEYRYADYTGDSLTAVFFPPSAANGNNPIDSFTATVDQRTHTATVGVSYLFR